MNKSYSSIIVCILILAPFLRAQKITSNLTTDPQKAPFVLDDIHTFNKAFKLLTIDSDSIKILQTEYLDKGTPGLKMFIEKYDLGVERLMKAIQKRPEKYASLANLPDPLEEKITLYRKAYVKLKKYIPDVVYPPTYFLVAGYWGIGSGSVEGQLISVEKWNRPLEDKSTLLIHELVHFQQVVAVGYEKYAALFGPEKSLLGLCIREGIGEFFSFLVNGSITQGKALEFTLKNEKRLWIELQKEMNGSETGDWMWSKPADPKQPRHVGYAMGFRIVQSYYDTAPDKDIAVKEILSVMNYSEFLQKSGYANKFEE
jgi:hypothetical protein